MHIKNNYINKLKKFLFLRKIIFFLNIKFIRYIYIFYKLKKFFLNVL